MQQFYEYPSVTSRRDLVALFHNGEQNPVLKQINGQFVPFAQQRDKLGRLISRQSKQRERQGSSLTTKNKIDEIISQKVRLSNILVEKMFKINDLRDIKSSKVLNKVRILSTSRQKNPTPTIGQYDSAEVADKIKYKRSSNPIPIGLTKSQSNIKQRVSLDIKGKIKINKPKGQIIKNKQNSLPQQKLKQIPREIDYNLPQLEKYHEMRKLKLMHYDNFQENHLKFKELARHSLVLANQIKKRLENDD